MLSQAMKAQGYIYFISSYMEKKSSLLFIEAEMNCEKSIRYNCLRQVEAIRINIVEFLLLFLTLWVADQRKLMQPTSFLVFVSILRSDSFCRKKKKPRKKICDLFDSEWDFNWTYSLLKH